MDDFLIRAGLAGVVAAPLGCLKVWRRMARFGDATAPAAPPRRRHRVVVEKKDRVAWMIS